MKTFFVCTVFRPKTSRLTQARKKKNVVKKARSSVAGTTISSFMSCFSEVIYDDGDVSKKIEKSVKTRNNLMALLYLLEK